MEKRKKRERIFIVFHWAGLAFSFVVLLIFAIGFVFVMSRELTQILGIALVVAGVVAMIQTNENLRGLDISSCRSQPVAAGEDVALLVLVRNTAERERIGCEIRRAIEWRKGWPSWRARRNVSLWVPVLRADSSSTHTLFLPTQQRGRYPIPPLWVCSVMPVGLCFAWKSFLVGGEYTVYPAPKGIPLQGLLRHGRGKYVGASQGEEDVSGHRPYEKGDPLSRMDWRVFARTGKLVVRSLEEGGADEVAFSWEDTGFLRDEEVRLEQLSFWVAQCLHENRPFSLRLPAGTFSHKNVVACYEALATFGRMS